MDNKVISGKPAVIIRCGTDFSVGEIQFKKDQVVACITDSDVSFSYSKVEKTASKGAVNLIYGEQLSLSEVTISSVPMNKMLSTIVFGQTQSLVKRPVVLLKTADEKGRIPIDPKATDIAVYDNDFGVVDFEQEDSLILVEPYKLCKIVYNLVYENGIVMNLTPKQVPFFQLECIGRGTDIGEDRTSFTQIMYIKRASLNLNPFIRFNNGIENFNLSFTILEDKENEVRYVKQ